MKTNFLSIGGKALIVGSLFYFLSVFFYTAFAQTANTQTVKGRLLDTQSKSPLIGATVVVVGSSPLIGATTDSEGYYKLPNVPFGRVTLKISYIGYEEQVVPNVLVTSGKEVIMNFELVESLTTLEAVEIKADNGEEKGTLNNEMITVSARTFNLEETRRYAGSRNDPARMASNFAGVVGNNDSRNDIVIRGNSPTGLLWRMEGVDIPNPSHFGALGATGGPVSMLNNNVLDKSDFITGAFPAMYGNATAGVFDLQMRSGNNEKREYTGQLGFNGFELGAEGPFSKNSRASYLVNYRYSALGVFGKLGLNLGTGSSVPDYQDVSFKIDIPTTKAGRFTLFGIGGKSKITLKPETSDDNIYGDSTQQGYYATHSGMVGFSHLYFFNSKTYGKLTVAATSSAVSNLNDSISTENKVPFNIWDDQSAQNRLTVNYALNTKFSAKSNLSVGFFAHRLGFDYKTTFWRASKKSYEKLNDNQGDTYLMNGYAQWQYKFSPALTMNAGLHYQHFALNGSKSVEPRLGLRYQLAQNQSLNFAFGMHSQLAPLQAYFTKTRLDNGSYIETNQNLGFSKSNHYIVSYDNRLSQTLRMKVEAYYQNLYNVPVTQRPTYISSLNFGADFSVPDVDSLVNNGTGTNYGLELTLEKFYDKGYYFLATASLFDSKFAGSNGIVKNTAFNNNYVFNFLAGKEFKVSKKGVLSLDTKVTLAGGRRYTPLNVEASQAKGEAVYYEDQFNDKQFNDYFRWDVKLTYRRNGKKTMQEWFIDVQNVLNTQNVFFQYFDAKNSAQRTVYQLGLFPNVNYRIQF
jgi:hypothetical protein